eukprot:SAG31_NODE_22024_length_535_cov_1.236239_1_plen_54_part_00
MPTRAGVLCPEAAPRAGAAEAGMNRARTPNDEWRAAEKYFDTWQRYLLNLVGT